jgi:alkylation response protein AidB-like acyl-CoA dehydrogenase
MEGPAPVTDLLYSETEQALSDSLRELLADKCKPEQLIKRTETEQTTDPDLWRAVAADLGCAGLLIPERSGGAGATYREAACAAEALGASVAPVPYLGSAVVATAALLAVGNRESEKLLARLADGGVTAALVAGFETAPGGRFPVSVRVAGPKPGDGGTGISRLRGSVRGVADAMLAEVLLVPADGVPHGLYVIDMDTPRVVKTPVVSLDMTRQLCDITLDDAPASLIGSGDAASKAFQAALTAGAAMLAAEQLGLAQRCLDMTVAYVKERKQFARPVGSFQAIKHRLADLWVAVAQARAASRYAAACLAGGDADAAVAVAMAKAYCSDVAVLAAQECVQLHGGIGFTWEHPAHLYLKRAKADSIGFGTADKHRALLASLVNLPAP